MATLVTLAVLAAAASIPAEAAARRKKTRRRPAPIPEVPRPHDPFEVTFPTSDGVKLVATWKPSASGTSGPAVLLLHAFSRERRELADLADELGARGFSTLALDLRGHGESVWKGRTRLGTSPYLQSSPAGFPRDVEAACAWLRPRASRVGAVGFSLSGNLAALATAVGWADAAVAVSPNADHFSRLAGSRPVSPRGLLVLAAERDPGRASSARALDATGRDPKAVGLFPGAAHALDLLRTASAARTAAFAWLEARLGPVAPPPSPIATIPLPVPDAMPSTPKLEPTPGQEEP